MDKIIRNMIKCKVCGDIIESKYCHDFKQCSCESCGIDGGREYQRILYKEEGCYEDLSIIEKEDDN